MLSLVPNNACTTWCSKPHVYHALWSIMAHTCGLHHMRSHICGHLVAIKSAVIGHADAQDARITLEEIHAVLDPDIRGNIALEGPIYDVCREAKTSNAASSHVRARRGPLAGHHRMATGLWCLRRHPEPNGRLVGQHGVAGEERRVAEQQACVVQVHLAE